MSKDIMVRNIAMEQSKDTDMFGVVGISLLQHASLNVNDLLSL